MSRSRAFLAVALATVTVAGCAKGAPPIAHPTPSEATAGGTLRVGILPPHTVAPWLLSAYDPYGTLVVRTMCDPLASFDVTSGRLEPGIALSWRADGAAALVLKLRKGLTFNDGTPVHIDDVVSSISRVADSDVASPVSKLLEPVDGYVALSGLHQESDDPKQRERLSGISVLTSHSLRIALLQKDPDFARVLGHTLTAVVPQSAYKHDASALEREPACVGPYRLAEPWSPSARVITLVRAKAYYGANRGASRGGRGYADRVEFHVYPDARSLELGFRRGEVQVASGVSLDSAGAIAVPTPTVDYLGLPTTVAPFDNQRFRLALSLALDRTALSREIFHGVRTPASGFVPPAAGADYDRSSQKTCPLAVPASGKPNEARTLLGAEAAALVAKPIKLYFNELLDNRRVVEEVARQWRTALGLRVTLVPMSASAFVKRGSTTGFDGPFRMSWSPQVPTADDYLKPLFDTSGLGSDNWSRYADPGLDFIIDSSARGAAVEKVRRGKYELAQTLLCAMMPMIPLLDGGRAVLVDTTQVGSAVEPVADRSGGYVPLREIFVRGVR